MTITREEQIRNKARELGQEYFPDSSNIWARSNVEATYVENACVEMAEWADQHPHWIPVEEELPKHEDVYIVYEGKNMVLATFCPSDNTWWESEDDKIISVFPTHWMEIVPPRKEEKK